MVLQIDPVARPGQFDRAGQVEPGRAGGQAQHAVARAAPTMPELQALPFRVAMGLAQRDGHRSGAARIEAVRRGERIERGGGARRGGAVAAAVDLRTGCGEEPSGRADQRQIGRIVNVQIARRGALSGRQADRFGLDQAVQREHGVPCRALSRQRERRGDMEAQPARLAEHGSLHGPRHGRHEVGGAGQRHGDPVRTFIEPGDDVQVAIRRLRFSGCADGKRGVDGRDPPPHP